MVDLTFTTPALAATVAYRQVELVENLSDHRYIRIGFSSQLAQGTQGCSPFSRWSITYLDLQLGRRFTAFLQS